MIFKMKNEKWKMKMIFGRFFPVCIEQLKSIFVRKGFFFVAWCWVSESSDVIPRRVFLLATFNLSGFQNAFVKGKSFEKLTLFSRQIQRRPGPPSAATPTVRSVPAHRAHILPRHHSHSTAGKFPALPSTNAATLTTAKLPASTTAAVAVAATNSRTLLLRLPTAAVLRNAVPSPGHGGEQQQQRQTTAPEPGRRAATAVSIERHAHSRHPQLRSGSGPAATVDRPHRLGSKFLHGQPGKSTATVGGWEPPRAAAAASPAAVGAAAAAPAAGVSAVPEPADGRAEQRVPHAGSTGWVVRWRGDGAAAAASAWAYGEFRSGVVAESRRGAAFFESKSGGRGRGDDKGQEERRPETEGQCAGRDVAATGGAVGAGLAASHAGSALSRRPTAGNVPLFNFDINLTFQHTTAQKCLNQSSIHVGVCVYP